MLTSIMCPESLLYVSKSWGVWGISAFSFTVLYIFTCSKRTLSLHHLFLIADLDISLTLLYIFCYFLKVLNYDNKIAEAVLHTEAVKETVKSGTEVPMGMRIEQRIKSSTMLKG